MFGRIKRSHVALLFLGLSMIALSQFMSGCTNISIDEERGIITYYGPITKTSFEELVAAIPPAVDFNTFEISSPGGLLYEAYDIAALVSVMNLNTRVGWYGECLSACTVIYQVGVERIAHPTATFGYHYARDENGEIHNGVTALMFIMLNEYGVSPRLFPLIRGDGTLLELTAAEAMSYNIVTEIR